MKKEYIFGFRPLTSLDDYSIKTVVANNLEEAEKKARKNLYDSGNIREIRDIWEIKNSQKIRLL